MSAKESEPTQTEREFIDALERVEREPDEHSAVHLHLSQLQPSNRTPIKLKVASRFFGTLQQAYEMSVFVMSNGDIVVMGFDLPELEVNKVIERMKALFAGDPLLEATTPTKFGILQDSSQQNDRFATWYALEVEIDDLNKVAKGLLAEAEKLLQARRSAPPPIKQAGPGDMDGIIEQINKIDISPMIRRQSCLRFAPGDASGDLDSVAEVFFQEFFVSMMEMQKVVGGGMDILSDRWLFQYLASTVDEAILLALPNTTAFKIPNRISMNLNLVAMQGQRFSALLNNFPEDKKFIVEVHLTDTLANLKLFYRARDALREAGHAILLDSLSAAAVASLNLPLLDPDFVKVVWNNDMAGNFGQSGNAPDNSNFTKHLKDFPLDRVILSRTTTDLPIRWGRSHGILKFQGMWGDAALATMTMLKCPAAAQCTLKQCDQRRSWVTSRMRRECPNPPGLDMIQRFAAPRQGKSAGGAAKSQGR